MLSKRIYTPFFALCLVLLIIGCQPKVTPVLSVSLQWQGRSIDCDSLLTLANGQWRLSQLQVYIADIQNNQQAVVLQNDAPMQQASIALLGTDCHDAGIWQLQLTEPLQSGSVSFDVGVPQRLNHQDPLRAAAPLNQSDMFWSWQQGYKYLRLELQGEHDNWALHVGATGCQSASVLRAPTTACTAQNRVRVNLPYLSGQRLVLDLAPLLADFSAAATNNCMADALAVSCQLLLPRLGIDAPQQLWRFE